ncbi:hypothetical protein D1B33_16400 [Lysinibacillus yapensis]|uniref:Uncharacterized protein n=1 Tax=Ureibacillus yapensis TaxID=2304605 RepID=A0A396SB49_9BACL|nr:hypothetical protein [Lysinibacillus yapensis]RHW32747.1 hypothetical protein D1B33_16400 [Lysinibacillus yapensis]
MEQIRIVNETNPIVVAHDTYKRECCYTRGVHIPYKDFLEILDSMPTDTKIYFEFHNPGKQIAPGTYLNGHAGLARSIVNYYQNTRNMKVAYLHNGQDFYVKII